MEHVKTRNEAGAGEPASAALALEEGVERSGASRISGVIPLAHTASEAPAHSVPVSKAPPPRRARSATPPLGAAEHEAFKLERPLRASDAPERSPPRERSASAIMLPPPPGPRDYEPEPARPRKKPAVARPERALLTELPSLDPFAGLGRVKPSEPQPWLMLLLGAFALVGVAALVAVALGYVGKTGW